MADNTLFVNQKLKVSDEAPYDALGAFVRSNHIALKGSGSGLLADYVYSAKDVFKIKGSTMGNGHPEFLAYQEPDEFTSPVILKLLDSGADLVGKTICDELCYSISGENWNYGSPLNPCDVRRYTGGSSSGSCASVAGGLVDFSIGSDCLGSVRVPASYNGLIGMRPTYARIDNEGEAEYCESMDVLGFVAKEAEVFRKVATVLLGEDEKEYEFTELLIATDCFDAINEDVRKALQPAIQKISKYFNQVKEIRLADDLDEWVKVFQIVQGYEVWSSYKKFITDCHPQLSPGPRSRIAFASSIQKDDYERACERMAEIREEVIEKIPEHALLVMPTASSVAPLRSASQEEINHYRAQSSQLLVASPLSGIPQLTLPLAEQYGVPLGISLLGVHGCDRALVGKSLEIYENECQ